MAECIVFEAMSHELEAGTTLGRLAARGTLRMALRAGGLQASTLTPEQGLALLRLVLPQELESRGVADPAALCERMRRRIEALAAESSRTAAPEDLFRRLDRDPARS